MKKSLLLAVALGIGLSANAVDTNNAAANQTEGGWYTIKCTYSGATEANGNYIINADEEHRQNNTNWYALRWNRSGQFGYVTENADEQYKAKKFIYIQKSGNNYQFRGLNGHWQTYEGKSNRTASNTTIPNKIGNWHIYGPLTVSGQVYTYVGGSANGSTNNRFDIVEADISDYEVYSVIIGSGEATEIGQDTYITYTGSNNCGINRVFNNGTYFFKKGTVPTASDFTLTLSSNPAVTGVAPEIRVDNDAKTIIVGNTTEYDGDGWYTIKCLRSREADVAGKYIVNAAAAHQQSNNAASFYPFRWSEEAAGVDGAIYIQNTTTDNAYNIKGLDGHWVNNNYCVAARTPQAVTIYDNGYGRIGNWINYNDGDDTNMVGGNGTAAGAGANSLYEIKKLDVSGYDMYTVSITATNGGNVGADTRITYTGTGNNGVATTFNGGTYFFTKGVTPQASDFTISTPYNVTNDPKVTIDGNTISVTIQTVNEYTAEGWYTIRCIQSDDAAIVGKTIMNAAEERIQSGSNSYPLRWDIDNEATGVQTYVWMEDGTATNNYHFRALNGHWITNQVLASRAYADVPIANTNGNGNIGYWYSYTAENLDAYNYCGGNSANSAYSLYEIKPANMSGMTKYTVHITSINGSQAATDCKVTYNGNGNLGISTVYDGGVFFLTDGTVPTADDFTVTPPYPTESADVTIDGTDINVVVNGQQSSINYDGEGWYTIKCTMTPTSEAAGKYLMAAPSERSQNLNGTMNTYPVRYDVDAEASAIQKAFYIKATDAANTYNIRTITGRWLTSFALAHRDAQAVAVASNGLGKIGQWAPYINADMDEYTYVGGYNGASSDPNRFEVVKIDVDAYDIYTVDMVGETITSTDRTLDACVTYNGEAECAGLPTVYEGGVYFFPKGTELSSYDFVANQDGNDALITIGEDEEGNKIITVDFAAISGKARTLLQFAEEHSGTGLHNGTFTGIEELQSSYDALMARIDAGDDDEALAPLRSACTTAYNAVTFTINPVEKGRYIRIRSSLHTQYAYASKGTSFGFVTDVEGEDEHDIFYYDADGHLLNYTDGVAVKEASSMGSNCSAAEHATLANASTITFNGSDNRYRGKYLVSYLNGTANRALYCFDNGNLGEGGDPANPGTTTFTLDYYQHCMFDLEYVDVLPVNIVNGMGSLMCPKAVDLQGDDKAWVAQMNGSTISWNGPVTHIPAYAHAVIYSPAPVNGKTYVTVDNTEEGEYEANDHLKGHHLTMQHSGDGKPNFVLNLTAVTSAEGDDAEEETPAAPTGVTLQKVESEGDVTLPPHTFALNVTSPRATADTLELPFNAAVNLADVNTSISEITANDAADAVVYDLQGRRLSEPRKGAVNIVNGKKLFVY